MRRRISKWAVPAVVGMAALVLAGCSGSTSPTGDDAESPLSEYFSAFYGGELSEDEQEAKFAEDQKAREELIAQCMQEEGFEYIPMDAGNISFGGGEEWKPDDREWVSQWGYGAIEYPGQDEMPTEDQTTTDPNEDYIMSLSESEQTAFYAALYGPGPTEEELDADGGYEYNWETAGCNGWADHEINGDDPLQSDEFADVMDAMSTMYETVATSPKMTELDAAWAACMDDAGYPGFASQFDAQNSIYDELNKLYEGMGEDGSRDEAAFDALHEEEIELALADLDCREDVDYRAEYQKIQFEIEEQFIADHKTDLDAMKAAAEQARS